MASEQDVAAHLRAKGKAGIHVVAPCFIKTHLGPVGKVAGKLSVCLADVTAEKQVSLACTPNEGSKILN